MKAIAVKTIDGHEIFCGVAKPIIDPVASGRVAFKELRILERLNEKILELGAISHEHAKEIGRAFEDEIADYTQKHPVFFDCVPGQRLVDDETADQLIAAAKCLDPCEVLTTAGEIIKDYRGKVFWSFRCGRWSNSQILALGETLPPGAIWESELSEEQSTRIVEQRESDRIAGLSAEEVEAEIQAIRGHLVKRASELRGELEIQGVESGEALARARKWYDDESGRVHRKYSHNPKR